MGVKLTERAASRTAEVVRRVLGDRERGKSPGPRHPGIPTPFLAFADGDIGINATATLDIAEDTSTTLEPSAKTRDATNLWDMRIWDGSLCVVQWLSAINGGGWYITWTNAARRVYGAAPGGGILAGASGSIVGPVPLSGHFPSGVGIVATNWTQNNDIAGGVGLRAEWNEQLTFWEIYVADCAPP